MKKEYIIPIFVPHLGCPQDCTFCNQKKISGQTKMITANDVRATIEQYLNSFMDKNKYTEVAFFGGSFTGIEVEKQEELLSVAFEFIKNKKINSIRISTRPDYINEEILKRLKKYGVKTIELGVQSSNDSILRSCRRGHTFEDVIKASKLIKKYRFVLGHQMMVGLPESTRSDEIKTASDLIALKPKIVRIYPVLVVKGTELEIQYNEGKYAPLSVEYAADTSKELLTMFNKKRINVIRIGLQNTNEIQSPNNKDSQVVAGPYHPAFRQVVESLIWYEKLQTKIKKLKSIVKKIRIDVNPKDINEAIGHRKSNIEKIKKDYEIRAEIRANKRIKKGRFKISIIE